MGNMYIYITLWVLQPIIVTLTHQLSYSPLTVKGPRYATYPADKSTSPATLLTRYSRCCTVSFQRTFSSASPPISWKKLTHHHYATINIKGVKYFEINIRKIVILIRQYYTAFPLAYLRANTAA